MSAICLLGFNPIYALVSYALVLLYQLPLHQMWTGRLPTWYEFFFNTPMHHRAHHAYQRMYIDKNFGGITIIWDRIFGTFVEVDDSIPPEFGLTQKVVQPLQDHDCRVRPYGLEHQGDAYPARSRASPFPAPVLAAV
jgi:sterol desaturase/sphingolipid hydroxylase (fatty acid hydroxylase superfamily)